MALDLEQHLCRHIAFSRATFGPGQRTADIIDHIRKELVGVEKAGGSPEEWVDVVILALDGLTRSIIFAGGGCGETDDAAAEAAHMIREKQGINERRDWSDWRMAKHGEAIKLDRVTVDIPEADAPKVLADLRGALQASRGKLRPGRHPQPCVCPICWSSMEDPA